MSGEGFVKDQIDAVLRLLDDFGFDRCGEPALATIQRQDPFDIVLDFGAGIDDARTQGNFLFDVVVFQPLVAFKRDAVDHRIFDHGNDQRSPFATDRHVGEQAGAEQAFQGPIDPAIVVGIAFLDQHIRQDGSRFDTLVAFDRNFANRAG